MKNNVIKNTIMLYGMSIAKIVFPLLTLPYLTRVLSLDGYGLVSYVKSVMQYMQIIIDFGFMLSGTKEIVLVKDNQEELDSIVGNILLSRIILSIGAFVCLCLLTLFIPLLKGNVLFTMLSFIPIFLTVFLYDYLFRGLEKMQVITVRFIIMKGISAVLTFFIVKSDKDMMWIPLLDIVGTLIAVILVYRTIIKMKISIQLGNYKTAIKRLVDSAIYFVSNMATTAFGALNTVIIGACLPSVDVAYWSVCMQLIGGIQSMYSPIVDGIYPEMVKNKDLDLPKKTLKLFMPIILIGCVFSFYVAPYALKIVAGEQYVNATWVFRSLLPILLFSFPGMILGWPTLGAFNLQNKVTSSTIVSALFQIIGLFVLFFINKINLFYVALLRGTTELLLASLRFCYLKKYVIEVDK